MRLIISRIKKMNSRILLVLFTGFKICFILLLLATFLLSLYHTIANYNLFYIGITLFKNSLFYFVFLIICALGVDTIKKDLKL